jgi:hypothetical protein
MHKIPNKKAISYTPKRHKINELNPINPLDIHKYCVISKGIIIMKVTKSA